MAAGAAERGALAGELEAALVEAVHAIVPARRTGPGRPPLITAAVLWASLTLAVLRGATSQLAVWRIVVARGLWPGARLEVSDEAVYRRLAAADPRAMGLLFRQVTEPLVARHDADDHAGLAPFAADVVAVDETALEQVARWLPGLRGEPAGSDALPPGKLAEVFDLRRQLWRTVELIPRPHQNEKVAARALLTTLPRGTLILADLGYFSFEWFDAVSAAGCWWISRLRAKTSYTVVHAHYRDDATFDGLVWLGAHRADKAAHLVRLVRFRVGPTTHAYLTNVRDPHLLPLAELARLYARRWDIELAVKLVKRELGPALWWSAKPAVVRQQLWATLLIAQLLRALRGAVAAEAGVDGFDVSMALLIRHLPDYVARFADPIAAFVADGKLMGCIRPSSRTRIRAPIIPRTQLVPPPADLPLLRLPRYAERNCGPRPAPKTKPTN